MKAFISHTFEGVDSLVLEDIPAPGATTAGQVRVKMRAASVNYRDIFVLSGAFRGRTVPNLIICSDGAGEVMEVASDVWRVRPGDRVAMTFNPHWMGGAWQLSPGASGRGGALQGVMCEEWLFNQDELVVLPKHLSFEEGAALPCAAVTAWHALCGDQALMPGMSVLLQGGGGVSLFALQFAKLFGARVIMISSSSERCEKLRALGADETINYKDTPQWEVVVKNLTGGSGVDLTVDVGGAATIEQSLASTRIDGRLSMVGLLSGPPPAVSVFSSGVRISPIKVGSREDFESMNRAIAFHQLRPVIDSSYSFNELPAALRRLETGKHFGKIVIKFG
jgi:NADPH:quinone reductase-like Zn-dependent oxidoreductase